MPQAMFMVPAGFIPHKSGCLGSALELEERTGQKLSVSAE